MNYHPQGELRSTKLWLTFVYTATHFNSYERAEIASQILKRIIVYRETGNTWIFKGSKGYK